VEAGASGLPATQPRAVGSFRDRVMFRSRTLAAGVIAFGGRRWKRTVPAEIPQFAGNAAVSQGRNLYNSPLRARQPIRSPDRVEGYVRRHRHGHLGLAGSVAPLGTA